jgi:hypothetical protein
MLRLNLDICCGKELHTVACENDDCRILKVDVHIMEIKQANQKSVSSQCDSVLR